MGCTARTPACAIRSGEWKPSSACGM
jgi:hypothetical protein